MSYRAPVADIAFALKYFSGFGAALAEGLYGDLDEDLVNSVLEEAGRFHAEWTPRGWAKRDSLTAFEQLLYLRQPGYGSCYITGKLLADRLMMEYAHQQDLAGKPFVLRDFLDRFNNEGMIPILLMEPEMVPNSSERPLQPQRP